MMKNKVLVIAAHMDDEVLGCGGVIAKHIDKNDKVCVIFVAHRIYKHSFSLKVNEVEKKHAGKAKDVLGYSDATFLDLSDERLDGSVQDIIIPLEFHVKRIKPDIIYLPFSGDNNQDHRAVFEAARVALRPLSCPFVKGIYMYEVPSSTDQSPPFSKYTFMPNYFVDVTEFFGAKIRAYKCYKTEKRNYPHPRSEQALKILAQKRGIESNFTYAEAFVVVRNKWF